MSDLPERLRTKVRGRVLRRRPSEFIRGKHEYRAGVPSWSPGATPRCYAVRPTTTGRWFANSCGKSEPAGVMPTTLFFRDPEAAARALDKLLRTPPAGGADGGSR